MGPPDENLILGSDPAVLSSPSFNAYGNSILHLKVLSSEMDPAEIRLIRKAFLKGIVASGF